MSDKTKTFSELESAEYMVEGETVAQIVVALLNLVLAFVTPEQAKALLDDASVRAANDAADALEKAKFGN